MHVLFTSDKHYLTYCGVCIFSIIEANPGFKIKFHIFVDEYDQLFSATFFSIYRHVSATVYLLDNNIFSGLQVYDFYPKSIYYRIIASNILASEAGVLFYLDCDIVCNGDISSLLEIDMKNYTIAAVHDKGMNKDYLRYLGLSNDKKYFNSGVMLINTQAWVKNNVMETFFEKIQERKYQYPDQDCLNIILDQEVFFLDQAFNFIPKNKNSDKKPIFIHYAGQTKPWSISIEETGYNKLYIDIYNQSPWKDVPLVPPKKAYESFHYAKKLLLKRKIVLASFWLTISICQFLSKKIRSVF